MYTCRIVFSALWFVTSISQAQVVVIPPSVEPGQIQRQLKEQGVPRPEEQQILRPTPTQALPTKTADLQFVLREVQIDGATTDSRQDMLRRFEPLIGQIISVEQVFQIANDETARYRGNGFILSQVLVPEQTITDGKVRVVAVEGYIEDVQFRGDVPANQELLAAYAQALTRSRPLTAAVLERYLLLMNDLGRSAARGTLVPSTRTQGAADLVVDFARERLSTTVATSNRNSKSLGPQRVTVDVDGYGAITNWDHVGLLVGSTLNDELNYADLSYGSTLGSDGLQWNAGVSGVRARPGRAVNLTTTDLETESLSGFLQVTYPILRSRARNLYVRATATSFDGKSEFLSAQLSDDRVRALRAGFTFDYADRLRGISVVDLEYAQGLDALGTRKRGTLDAPLSRTNGRPDFSKMTLYAARLQSLGGPWSVLGAVSAQQAFTTLLSPELFAFGGEFFGRSYDAAELVGDSGEAAKLELRFLGSNSLLRVANYSLYSFFDWGRVRRRDPINESMREDAACAGAGLRVTDLAGRWQGFFEVAGPLNHDVAAEGDRDPRFFLGLQVNL